MNMNRMAMADLKRVLGKFNQVASERDDKVKSVTRRSKLMRRTAKWPKLGRFSSLRKIQRS